MTAPRASADLTKPGLYTLTEDEYHADPCPEASLSASLSKVLLADSPRHAWTVHPKLNPNFEASHKTTFDLGHAAHSMMLGGEDKFCVIDADSWRSKSAKDARDAAYEAGEIPILVDAFHDTQAMVKAGCQQLDVHQDASDAFSGPTEQTIVWREGNIWCRSRIDGLPEGTPDPFIIDDYKTTGVSANPDSWVNTLYGMGADVQAAFYRRGVAVVIGIPISKIHFRFVVQENTPPFALSVVALTPAAMDMAERKVVQAIDLWGWCMESGVWPGYPNRTCYVDTPFGHEKRWIEREEREDAMRNNGKDIREFLMRWNAPIKQEGAMP